MCFSFSKYVFLHILPNTPGGLFSNSFSVAPFQQLLFKSHRGAKRNPSLLPPKRLRFPSRRRNLGFCFKSLCSTIDSNNIAMGAPLTVKETIDLTETEEKIFNRLLDVLRHFQLDTQLRVAGGWVRDKLLGKECCDIDIALDNMLGREFCEKVNEYLQYAGEEQQGIGVIQCNPDQSKHLETARMHIYDTWIDFVNLRSETYVENSRIPTMKFGTAIEDAYRRDLTINSLFYNINTTSVEDLTGRGVQDLKAGYIVTPLPPKDTFLDDPLRVLRAIRFGARFNFVLDEELKKAASDMEVRSAIADKISRERIGHEIDLMISGNHPIKAMTYVCDSQLFSAVFTYPENYQPSAIEGCDRLCISYMEAAWKIIHSIGYSIFSDEHRRLYLYGALFLPLRNTVYKDRKSKMIPVTNHIFRNSLKLKASYADMVMKLHAESKNFISLISFLERNENSKFVEVEFEDEYLDIPLASRGRVLSGLLLSKMKDYWRVALLLSTLLYPEVIRNGDIPNVHFELDSARDIFLRIQDVITKLDLDNIWNMKPLLDGVAIMGALKLKSGGPKITEWQHRVRKWQLAHPEGTTEECLDWIERSQVKRLKLDSDV